MFALLPFYYGNTSKTAELLNSEPFAPLLHNHSLEIHKVFLRLCCLPGTKNLRCHLVHLFYRRYCGMRTLLRNRALKYTKYSCVCVTCLVPKSLADLHSISNGVHPHLTNVIKRRAVIPKGMSSRPSAARGGIYALSFLQSRIYTRGSFDSLCSLKMSRNRILQSLAK